MNFHSPQCVARFCLGRSQHPYRKPPSNNAHAGRVSLPWLALVLSLACGLVWLSGASPVARAAEELRLFADAGHRVSKTRFTLGETVWAVGAGLPAVIGWQQRRLQWIAPGGTVEQQKELSGNSQADSFRIPPAAAVGTWRVRLIDPSGNGLAATEFVVADAREEKAAVDLAVNLSGPPRISSGEKLTYTVSVTNNGPNAARAVHLNLALTGNANFQGVTDASEGWNCQEDSAGIACTVANLPSDTVGSITLVFASQAQAVADAMIAARAEVTSATPERHAPDNTANLKTIVSAPACPLSHPENITQPHDAGRNGATVAYPTPTSEGKTCAPAVCNPPSGSFFPAGVTTVTCSSQGGEAVSFSVTITGTVAVTLNGPEQVLVEAHTEFRDPGATAQNGDGNEVPISATGTVEVEKPGDYTITYTATENGSTATVTRQVKVIDTTPPLIQCPADIATRLPRNLTANAMPVSYTVTATDGGAPVPVETNRASGALFAVGTTTVTATATDTAGNRSTCEFKVAVQHNFSSPFFISSGAPHEVQAGSVVPITFSLSGNKGFDVLAPNYPASSAIACPTHKAIAPSPLVPAQPQSFLYDPSGDQYAYQWKTEPVWAGTCRQLIIQLSDGSEHRAVFRFR